MRFGQDGTRAHLLVTGAKSRSHLVYVAAYVREVLQRRGLEQVRISFVPAGGFLSAPAVELADLVELLPHDERLSVEEGLPEWRFDPAAMAEYVAVGAPGVSALARLRRAQPRRRCAVVVTDEGIGTYGSAATRRAAMQRQGMSTPEAVARSAALAGVAAAFTTRRWAAYERTGAGWQVNERIAAEFRRDVATVTPGSTRDAIVLTQPFADLGLIDDDRQVSYVDALMHAARAAGLRPLLRPHPAEDVARYAGYEIMPGRGTAELDPDVVGAAVVLGGPSTALVNMAAMHGSSVVWVSIPGLEHLDTRISRRQAEIFRTFLGRPLPIADAEVAIRTRSLPAR